MKKLGGHIFHGAMMCIIGHSKKLAVRTKNSVNLSGNSTQPILQREEAKMMVKEVNTP